MSAPTHQPNDASTQSGPFAPNPGETHQEASSAAARLSFDYQLLARLQLDCDYYLGHGARAKKHLWAGDEAAQIQKMRELYEALPEKPEWLTLDEISRYEAAMVGHGMDARGAKAEAHSA